MAVIEISQTRVPLAINFDRNADVFYVSTGWEGPVEGMGCYDGIELNFQHDTTLPCGVTVIGFHAYGWAKRLPELADVIADHLHVPNDQIYAALTASLG